MLVPPLASPSSPSSSSSSPPSSSSPMAGTPHCWCRLLALLAAALLAAPDAVLGAALPEHADATTTEPSEPAEHEEQAAGQAEECVREQSRCEAELALQAGQWAGGAGTAGRASLRPGRPVCGSDNATYDNECHLKRVQCEGRDVVLAHRGKCKDHAPCLSFRRRAARAQYSGNVFMPQCQSDGSYEPLQCHDKLGYCWCVTPQGRPLPHLAVTAVGATGKKPNCTRPAKTRRGSGPRGSAGRHGGGRGPWQHSARGRRRRCGGRARADFKHNLISIFRSEFRRAALASGTPPAPGLGAGAAADMALVAWKFAQLDTDGDGLLRRTESHELRRFVRKMVPPEACARTFARRCDMDRNKIISRFEWETCFGPEIKRMGPGQSPAEASRAQARRGAGGPGDPFVGPNRAKSAKKSSGRHGGLRRERRPKRPKLKKASKSSAGPQVLQESSSDLAAPLPDGMLLDNLEHREEEPEATDCLTDRRQAVLEEQRAASSVLEAPEGQRAARSALYIPECTADGRYNKLQCYNSTGYCWCVNEDTGKPIPGTSAKDRRPACDTLAPTMKGCPEVRKKEFLKNLREFFKQRMQMALNESDSSSPISWQVSPEDRIATWNFLTFDKNKNKVLDRPEWKGFRQLVSEHQLLRRCGKKLPRYCDANQDRSITITEWLDCLRPPPAVETVTVTSHVRRGPNPIESYLKDD